MAATQGDGFQFEFDTAPADPDHHRHADAGGNGRRAADDGAPITGCNGDSTAAMTTTGDHASRASAVVQHNAFTAATFDVNAARSGFDAAALLFVDVRMVDLGLEPCSAPTLEPIGTESSLRIWHHRLVTDDELQGAGRHDIVPERYLGGFKVWSCAHDVAAVLASVLRRLPAGAAPALVPHGDPSAPTTAAMLWEFASALRSGRVIEAGCGQGLPSIAALSCGAADVTLHDYNESVIRRCTVPNVEANVSKCVTESPGAMARDWVVSTCSGAWDALPVGPSFWFDAIVGSDVSYDDATAGRFVEFVNRVATAAAAARPRHGGVEETPCTTRPAGKAVWLLVGSKQYYFGTGGGWRCLGPMLQAGGWRHAATLADVHDGRSMGRSVQLWVIG